ncbi:hypothetical protein ASD01_21275 [Ensifer sp. Root423]|nr:hypothetical protein ASD01_21275 [Ensifer sp. Root423]
MADQVAAAHLISNVADEARETAIGPLTVARTRGLPKRASGKHPPRPSPRTASEPTEQQSDLESRLAPTMVLEELVSLDAENSRLRKLLGEQLRAQNVTLKKMLERF